MMDKAAARKILEEYVARLAEHFDVVHISVSWTDDSGKKTDGDHIGRGNWYARQAMAQEFIDRGMAWEIGDAVARATKDDDDE